MIVTFCLFSSTASLIFRCTNVSCHGESTLLMSFCHFRFWKASFVIPMLIRILVSYFICMRWCYQLYLEDVSAKGGRILSIKKGRIHTDQLCFQFCNYFQNCCCLDHHYVKRIITKNVELVSSIIDISSRFVKCCMVLSF